MIRKKILIVAAHPDDEVLGAGGTIAKYVSEGAIVKLLIVTDGSTSQYRNEADILKILEEKKCETENAAKELGIAEVIYGGLPDMKLDVTEHIKVNQVIETVIDDFQPEVVFTQFYGDVNMDHQCVYKSTMVACRPVPGQCVKELYSYYVPSSTDWAVHNLNSVFLPNYYVDIDGIYAEKKYKAMECYATELRDFPHPRSIESLKIIDRANGIHVGLKCAECFMLHRSVR